MSNKDNQVQTSSNASTGNAKALIGVLFLQYCSYAFFYLGDHIKEIYPAHFKLLTQEK